MSPWLWAVQAQSEVDVAWEVQGREHGIWVRREWGRDECGMGGNGVDVGERQ